MWAATALLAGSFIGYDIYRKKKSKASQMNEFDEQQKRDWNKHILEKQQAELAAKAGQTAGAKAAAPPK
jgi:uncharacterized membrane-anchored protein YhcB (DUF1043 family)